MDIFYPLQILTDFLIYDLFRITENTHLAASLYFFIYGSIKIIILLLLITQVMSFINVVFPVEKIKKFLTTKKLY